MRHFEEYDTEEWDKYYRDMETHKLDRWSIWDYVPVEVSTDPADDPDADPYTDVTYIDIKRANA